MKKLNNKGFTLVELLAVIVILAIVVGITMVTILPTLSNAKSKAFETAVETVQRFVQEEYDKCVVGNVTVSGSFHEIFNKDCTVNTDKYGDVLNITGYSDDMEIVKDSITVSGGKVQLKAYPKADGKFAGVSKYTSSSAYTAG